MSIFSSFDIAATGLTAQRTRIDVISGNIANVNTTRTAEGGPYVRKRTIMEPVGGEMEFLWYMPPWKKPPVPQEPGRGVQISEIKNETLEPFKRVYDPGHPDAGKDGYVLMPNINIVEEMVDMISASRAYEANVASIRATKTMINSALEIGRGR